MLILARSFPLDFEEDLVIHIQLACNCTNLQYLLLLFYQKARDVDSFWQLINRVNLTTAFSGLIAST